MKSEEITQEINGYNKEIAALRAEMDKLLIESKEEMPKVAGTWIREEVQRQLQANSEKVAVWDMEKMKALKTKINELTDELPAIVESVFGETNKSPHYSEKEWDFPSTYQGGWTGYISYLFSQVVNNLGFVLHDYDLLSAGADSSWRYHEDKYQYWGKKTIDQDANVRVQDYATLYGKYLNIGRKIKDAQRRLAEAKAVEMWDEA